MGLKANDVKRQWIEKCCNKFKKPLETQVIPREI
jgi:hypothetical protein